MRIISDAAGDRDENRYAWAVSQFFSLHKEMPCVVVVTCSRRWNVARESHDARKGSYSGNANLVVGPFLCHAVSCFSEEVEKRE